MSERTLGKARGLNSIADPSEFKGSRGRGRAHRGQEPPTETEPPVRTDPSPTRAPDVDQNAAPTERERFGYGAESAEREPFAHVTADPAPPLPTPGVEPADSRADQTKPVPRRRGRPPVDPRVKRARRELSIPLPVAEALNETGINPADVVMRAYRKYADSIYAGTGGRLMSRGRERLRLSVSDSDFEKLSRLGQARGWNRSETVAVLLALELLDGAEAAG